MNATETSPNDPGDLLEAVRELESVLITTARDGAGSNDEYFELRQRLLSAIKDEALAPEFLRGFGSLDEFVAYIQKIPEDMRAPLIKEAIEPLHELFGTALGRLRVEVPHAQRLALEELRQIYLDSSDWPIHAYLEEQLEVKGIELDAELREIPPLMVHPDKRRHGGVVAFQDNERIQLLLRGLAACTTSDRELAMFVSTIRWAVDLRRSTPQEPHSVVDVRVPAVAAIPAMAQALGGIDPPFHAVKLVLEAMRMELADVPRWEGQPADFNTWELHVPTGIKRLRAVQSISDYLAATEPDLPPPPRPPVEEPRVAADEHPIFGRPIKRPDSFDCFVIMPLREPFLTIYKSVIKPSADAFDLKCGHAMDIFRPGSIMRDVYSAITFANVIIADLTGRNANVFYELGIAHEQGKEVVQLVQEMKDVPFDVQGLRTVVYEWSGADPDIEAFQRKLMKHLEAALHASGGRA